MINPQSLAVPTAQVDVTILRDGYSVPTPLHATVMHVVTKALPGMQSGRTYTCEQVCGEDFWAQLTRTQRRIAGRCLANAVALGQVPLCHVRGRHEYPFRYHLK